jgi:hypothetical protein
MNALDLTLRDLLPLLPATGLAALQYALIEADTIPAGLEGTLIRAHMAIEAQADALIGADDFAALCQTIFTVLDDIQY